MVSGAFQSLVMQQYDFVVPTFERNPLNQLINQRSGECGGASAGCHQAAGLAENVPGHTQEADVVDGGSDLRGRDGLLR